MCADTNLLGTWELTRDPPAPGRLHVQLGLDSVIDGRHVRTRVTFLMVGNVGIDPTPYPPTWGWISPGCNVQLTIGDPNGDDPIGIIAGTLDRDTVLVSRLQWAGASHLRADETVRLVRREP